VYISFTAHMEKLFCKSIDKCRNHTIDVPDSEVSTCLKTLVLI
jgi:hypothetical protein